MRSRYAVPLCVLMALASPVQAQAPIAVTGPAPDPELTPEGLGLSPRNAYTEIQPGYVIGDGDAFESITLSVGQIYRPKKNLAGIRFPVMATLDLAEMVQALGKGTKSPKEAREEVEKLGLSRRGITAGVFPYYDLKVGEAPWIVSVHGGVAGRLNAFADSLAEDQTEWLPQLRSTVGIDLFWTKLPWRAADANPAAISIEAVRLDFQEGDYEKIFGQRLTTRTFGEVVAIIPLTNKIGLIGEYVFGDEEMGALRAAILWLPGDDDEQE